MEEQLGYPKYEEMNKHNKDNGHTQNTLRSDNRELKITTSRDKESSFEPVLASKHQSRINGFDEKIIFSYAKGQTTTEIVDTIKDLNDVTILNKMAEQTTEHYLSYCLFGIHYR